MNATVTYTMGCVKSSLCKQEAWTIFEVTTPALGSKRWNPIAIFNLESEAMRFMGHVFLWTKEVSPVVLALPAEVQRGFESELRLNSTYGRKT